MFLTLQSITADVTQLQHVAQLAHPQNITPISHNAIRCGGINADNPAAFTQLQTDIHNAAFSATLQSLSDFKLLAMDMDSTLITIECIDEIADMQGLKPQVSAITEAAMRGELAFSESLTKRVALLKGLPESALQKVFDERVQLSQGAQNMLTAIQQAGIKTLLVSGGFTYFTDRIKAQLNLDFSHSNQLEIINGYLTGRVLGTIVDATQKRLTVEKICQQLHITPQQTIVMGDGANDLEMMRIAGLSVAFRAKPVVRSKADVALNFVGLDGVLNLLN